MKSKLCNFSDSTYKPKALVFAPKTGCLGFLYETVSQVQQRGARGGTQDTVKFIILAGRREGRRRRPHGKDTRVNERQETGARGGRAGGRRLCVLVTRVGGSGARSRVLRPWPLVVFP